MVRGSPYTRKLKAWTSKANHGQKPAKHKPRHMKTYKQILAARKAAR
jgi:hypothetical protein